MKLNVCDWVKYINDLFLGEWWRDSQKDYLYGNLMIYMGYLKFRYI